MLKKPSGLVWAFVPLLLIGCETVSGKDGKQRVVSATDSVNLCYSLIDQSFKLDRSMALRELKKRDVTSCVNVIPEHECPESIELRQACLEQSKIKTLADVDRPANGGQGTELMIQGLKYGTGILPF